MHDFTLFLLKNWLPVGVASITFFLIGLLFAKFIWGRWSQRLAFAVEENLNLASQWNALGSSQRDLFKKLRARWQSDRDVWEARLVETETLVAQKDARIVQLTSQLSGSGKEIPAEIEFNSKLVEEIERLKSEVRHHEEANQKLKSELASPVQPVSLLASVPAASGGSELETKISDLEKDLIDTHDELHQVRNDYLMQVELVEVLESRIQGGANRSAPSTEAKKASQLEALVALKSQDLLNFRNEILTLKKRNEELQAELSNGAHQDEFESMRVELEAASKSLAAAQIKIADRDSDIAGLRLEVSSREKKIGEIEDQLAKLDVVEHRRSLLQLDLNDACHEMYDVRNALNQRLDEIEMLEARIDELDPIEEAHKALELELTDTRHELSDVRIAFNEKVAELERKTAEMDELEAIIEDRGAEVNDLSSELRQKRDELRLLKNTLAETEGELEAINEEASSFTATLNGKESFLEEQARRISDLESALAERYAELNSVRSNFDDETKDAKYHESRAERFEAELKRREEEFKASDARVANAEEEVGKARLQIDELTGRLTESEQSVLDLQSSLQSLSREKDDTIRELEQATRRVEELEEATREREEHVASIEQEWRTGQSHSESLERQLAKLNVEMEEARENRHHTQVAIEELEEALKSSDNRVLSLSTSIDSKDSELTSVKAEIEMLQAQLSGQDGSVQGIHELKKKVEKRGHAIRDLQNEVSKIMMQRSARENEVSMLKEKLRKVERELIRARELTTNSSTSMMATPPSVKDLEAALQQSLVDEEAKSGGTSLDQLDQDSLQQKREISTEAHHAQSEADDDANTIYFDESSSGLQEKEISKIDEFARLVRRSTKLTVTVIGFAGAEGTPDLTEALSARRADAVRERLLERGVPQSKIEVKSSGQDRKFNNWRARRVDLVAAPIAVAESVN
ncbi:MAG: OmpA family protein [Verrucomicrobiales bacterium]|nr:OmpA family protein [Verrucomicrobiales bacterium]